MCKIPDYLKPYQDAVEEHGGTFDATLWRSRDGQVLRFKTFCDLIDFTGVSILDVGCGVGDFSEYLIQRKIKFKSFHGIDAMEAMIATAKNRQLEGSTFSVCDMVEDSDIFTGFDWITFSGSLNAIDENIAMATVNAAYERCERGVAFNFLSNQSDHESTSEDLSPATRFNTMQWIESALSLSKSVDFTQSYLNGHDATIVIHR